MFTVSDVVTIAVVKELVVISLRFAYNHISNLVELVCCLVVLCLAYIIL